MSETNWHKIHSKLQGICTSCGGELPQHIGMCELEAEQLLDRLAIIDESVKHVGDIANDLLTRYKIDKKELDNNV